MLALALRRTYLTGVPHRARQALERIATPAPRPPTPEEEAKLAWAWARVLSGDWASFTVERNRQPDGLRITPAVAPVVLTSND